MRQVIAEGITNWPAEDTQLVGSQCAGCGATTFPTQDRCPSCSGPNMTELLLPRTGTLVAWTTQGFYPGPGYITDPASFTPFAMGLVQLDDVIRVEGRLTESDPEKLAFGMNVEMTMVPIATDGEGNEIMTFAFAPA